MSDRMTIARLAYPVFARAVEDDDDAETVTDIMKAILAGTGEVWGLPRSALFSQVMDGPEGRWLKLGPAAGDLREIVAMAPDIAVWAKAAGCRWIDVYYSRAGWRRELEPHGYLPLGDDVLRKELKWD